MKKCIKCNLEKELTEFSKKTRSNDGFQTECKLCYSKYKKEHYIKNSEKIKEGQKEYQKEYYQNNLEKVKLKVKEWAIQNKDRVIENNKKYRIENKEKIKEYKNQWMKNKIKTDSLFKLRCNIRNLILGSIKGNGYTKKSKTNEYLGCSFEEFKIHLERQFTNGMNWSNAGKWHLDHIYPVSLAKDEEELIRLNHYTNFQPLWAIDNIKKGNKIINKQLTLI